MGNRIARHVASLAVWAIPGQIEQGWLLSAIRSMAVANRKGFADQMKRQLEGLSSDELEKLWEDWLCTYWTARSNGVPPLDAKEAKQMFMWAIFPTSTPLILSRLRYLSWMWRISLIRISLTN